MAMTTRDLQNHPAVVEAKRLHETGEGPEDGWRSRANCVDLDTSLFFPTRGAVQPEPYRACAGCEVAASCLLEQMVWERTSEMMTSNARTGVFCLSADNRRRASVFVLGPQTEVGTSEKEPVGFKRAPAGDRRVSFSPFLALYDWAGPTWEAKTGYSRRMKYEWTRKGVPVSSASVVCARIGIDPADVWSDWDGECAIPA